MDLKCQYPQCNKSFFWTGRGRKSLYCIPHRELINRQHAAAYTRTHRHEKKDVINNPDEAIVRPLVSYKFAGPGLFEPLKKLIDHALTVKSHTIGVPKAWLIDKWLPGQAGQQLVRSFMNPAAW